MHLISTCSGWKMTSGDNALDVKRATLFTIILCFASFSRVAICRIRSKRETPKRNRGDSNPRYTGTSPRSARRTDQQFIGRWLRSLPISCVIPRAPPIIIGESWHCILPGGARMRRERLCIAWKLFQSRRREVILKSGSTPKTTSPELAAAEGEKAAKGKVRTYVVQTGDTLVSISKKFYQAPSRWKDILDANQNQLSNPDELKAGQTIILP